MFTLTEIRKHYAIKALTTAACTVAAVIVFGFLARIVTFSLGHDFFYGFAICAGVAGAILIQNTSMQENLRMSWAINKSHESAHGKIRSAYNRVKGLPSENVNNDDNFRKFLNVIIDALNAGLSEKEVNNFLLKDLKTNYWIYKDFQFNQETGSDGQVFEPHGSVFLYCRRADNSNYTVVSVNLF